MTALVSPVTADLEVPNAPRAPSTTPRIVKWVARPIAQDLPAPEGFEDIEDIVQELESDAPTRALLETARRELARELPVAPESLAALRLARGWSQKRLADLIGTSQSHIARLECNRGDVMLSTANALAAKLGVSLEVVSRALDWKKRE